MPAAAGGDRSGHGGHDPEPGAERSRKELTLALAGRCAMNCWRGGSGCADPRDDRSCAARTVGIARRRADCSSHPPTAPRKAQAHRRQSYPQPARRTASAWRPRKPSARSTASPEAHARCAILVDLSQRETQALRAVRPADAREARGKMRFASRGNRRPLSCSNRPTCRRCCSRPVYQQSRRCRRLISPEGPARHCRRPGDPRPFRPQSAGGAAISPPRRGKICSPSEARDDV
jgi:hypothetical protein